MYTNISENTRIIGLCTGALAAAAVNYSSSPLDLIPKAVDAVIVAFRTGRYVADVATQVTGVSGTEECWSIIVPGATSSASVERFCKETVSHYCVNHADTHLETIKVDTDYLEDIATNKQTIRQRLCTKWYYRERTTRLARVSCELRTFHKLPIQMHTDIRTISCPTPIFAA